MLFVGTPASLLAARYCPRWKPAPRNPEEVPDVPAFPEESQEDIAPVRAPSSLADSAEQPEERENASDDPSVEATSSNEIRQSSNLTGPRWEKLEGDVRPREKRAAVYVPWTATWASAKPGRDPFAGPSRSSSFGPNTGEGLTAGRELVAGANSASEGPESMQAPLVDTSSVNAPREKSEKPQMKVEEQSAEGSAPGKKKRSRGSVYSRNQLWGALARASSWRSEGADGGRTLPHK